MIHLLDYKAHYTMGNILFLLLVTAARLAVLGALT